MRTPLLTTCAVAAVLATPAVAGADSIVYIDGGNVWSASPDGGRKLQLTDGGNWHSPTQADDGTVAAVQGTGPIQVMARDGRPLRSITTLPQPSADGGTFAARPVDLSLSPDGSKIAYSYVASSCPVASSCGTIQTSTFYTRADVTEATPVTTWGNQYGVHDPEWVTNERTLVFGGAGSQVSIDDLGPGDYNFTPWLTPSADQGDGEVSRDGRRLATTFFYGPDKVIAFFSVNGDVRTQSPPPAAAVLCSTGADEQLADPSWSPDGASVAFAGREGVEVMRFTRYEADDCPTTGNHVLSATGASPDWGPADPPATRYTPGGSPPPDGGGTGGGKPGSPGKTGGGTTRPPATKLVSFHAAAATRSALRRGLSVRVTAPKAGTVTVTLTRGPRRLGRRTVAVRRAGAVTVRLPKLSARMAASLRGRSVKLTVSATGRRTASRTLKVR